MIDDFLADLLAAAVDAITDPPARQYIAHGQTFAHDCDLLASRLAGFEFQRTDSRGCVLIPVAVLEVTLMRCWPKAGDNGQAIPTADAITAAATALALDGESLMNGIADRVEDGSLFADRCCADVEFTPGLQAVDPSGGLAGWTLTLTVRL